MTYADVLRRFDYDRFVRTHQTNCVAVYPRLTVGNTDIDEGFVTRFDKKAPELPFIDAGFSVLQTATLDLLPPSGPCSLEETVFVELARQGTLEAEVVDHDFFDIGTPEELARTRAVLEEK